MFAHLHTHSWYSFLEGLPSPAELAQAAAQAGLPALALTDVHSLTGAVEFQLACDSAGVQGILGLELLVELPSTQTEGVLLAQDALAGLTVLLEALPRPPPAQILQQVHPFPIWNGTPRGWFAWPETAAHGLCKPLSAAIQTTPARLPGCWRRFLRNRCISRRRYTNCRSAHAKRYRQNRSRS